MFTDHTFGNVLQFLENKEILRLITVSKGWYALTSEYLKNWRVLDCGKNQEIALRLADLGYKVELDLYHTQVADVSRLQNVHTLDLSHTKVTDVSALANVHTLYLRWTKVTDVSALGNVHTLNLRGTQVTDVSMLGNIYTLDLCNTEVSDVSALRKVHTLHWVGRKSRTFRCWETCIL